MTPLSPPMRTSYLEAPMAALGIGKDSANDVGVMGPHGGAANINNICFVGGRVGIEKSNCH